MITVLGQRGSQSRNYLAESLGVGTANSQSARRCRGNRFVINWGCSGYPERFKQGRLVLSNHPQDVKTCINKYYTFDSLSNHQVPCVEWAISRFGMYTPLGWLEEDGKIVVRHTVIGHSGAGIQIVRRGEQIPVAPLYTRYFRKQAEYRVHVFYGTVILIQQKKRMREERRNVEDANSDLIRTHSNGWTFAAHNLDCDTRAYRQQLIDLAIRAARAVGVNHCAVDILSNHERMEHVVCEINSAPGLSSTESKTAWTNAWKGYFEEHRII